MQWPGACPPRWVWQLPRGLYHHILPCFVGTLRQADDPFQVLGVHRGASAAEVRSAYLKAALRTHPDLAKGGTEAAKQGEAFRRVAEAYQQLRGRGGSNASAVPKEGWLRFCSVSQEQAEKLFRDAFNGRGLDDMLQEELGRLGLKPGVHTAAVREGILARLLRAAQAASHLPLQEVTEKARPEENWPRLDVHREPFVGSDGHKWVRIRTTTRWPNGRKEEHVLEKPVYRM
ncbi:dnaJ [Symbiodinium natans]|uniref:DnaJ protein n=1 Tax=Symbiodinium natans TaxID=878477 RepID=A0A812S731_9DINO|nr:dnaJ [Symbiodinium natans]